MSDPLPQATLTIDSSTAEKPCRDATRPVEDRVEDRHGISLLRAAGFVAWPGTKLESDPEQAGNRK